MKYPNLYLVGAPKCGTSSMFLYLSQHPEIFTPTMKEPCFFGSDLRRSFRRSERDYCKLFAGWRDERYALDGSPSTICSTRAAQEIKAASPDARILIMTRDPKEASHSLFNHNRLTGREPLPSFEASLAAEAERNSLPESPGGILENLLYSRMYDFETNIARFTDAFGDRVHVMAMEDLKANPDAVMQGLWQFLGLEPVPVETKVANAGGRVAVSRLVSRFANRPSPWMGKALFFVPRAWRLRFREWLKQVNSREEPPPPISPGAVKLLMEKFGD